MPLHREEGGGTPRLLLPEETGLSIASPAEGHAAAACSPPPAAQGLALTAPELCFGGADTQRSASSYATRHEEGRGEEPFHPADGFRWVCLPWCPTPASLVLRGRNFIF